METVQLVATFLLPEREKLRKLEDYINIFQEERKHAFLSRLIHAEVMFNLVKVMHQKNCPDWEQVLMDGFEIKFVFDAMPTESLVVLEEKILKLLKQCVKVKLNCNTLILARSAVSVDFI